MTITQKIIAEHSGKKCVSAGELVVVPVDLIMANDITAPVSIGEINRLTPKSKCFPEKTLFVLDHFTPNKDIKSAENCRMIREFSDRNGVRCYDGGNAGIEHALLPEKGHILPSSITVGADSHTCTYGALNAFSTGMGSTDIAAAYVTGNVWLKVPDAIEFRLHGKFQPNVSGKDLILHIIGLIGVDGATGLSMEFTGDTESLSIDDKFTICNMSVEAGAKNSVFAPDRTITEYIEEHVKREDLTKAFTFTYPDEGCYTKTIDIELSSIPLTVAYPHLPSNTKPLSEAKKDNIEINQVIIGSCTNGRYSDLEKAAAVLKGKKTCSRIRTIVIPATPEIYKKALKNGLLEIFCDSGCIISPPTCGPCLGGFMGILAKGEKAVSTTNRNFVGRMGHTESEVYLASPYTAAICALSGMLG